MYFAFDHQLRIIYGSITVHRKIKKRFKRNKMDRVLEIGKILKKNYYNKQFE